MYKIGFVCSSRSWGGLELNFAKLANWMRDRGWDVTTYIVKDTPLAEYILKLGLEVRYINYHKKYWDIKNSRVLKSKFIEDKIEVVFAVDNRDLSCLGITKGLMKNKIKLIYQQQMHIGVNKRDLIHAIRFSKIDAWIAPLQSLANEVKELTCFKMSKVSIIPLGVDVESLKSGKYPRDVAREKFNLNIEQDVTLFGIIGRFDRQKGQDFALRCIAELRNKGEKVELLIVGEPTKGEGEPYFAEINEIIAKNNLENIVHIRQFTYDVNQFFNSIDVFIMASDSETFGMVTIEALINDLPVMGTNSGGTPEILNFGEYGVLYQPRNVDEFVDKAIKLIHDEAKLIDLKSKVYNYAADKFSSQRECEMIEDLIMKIYK